MTPKVEGRGELCKARREIEQRVMTTATNGKQRARRKEMWGFGTRELSRWIIKSMVKKWSVVGPYNT